jgi:hypothetical protein
MRTLNSGSSSRVTMACGGIALIACLVVIVSTPNDAYWVVDSGSKALMAHRLLETGYGELNFDYPAAHLDPEGVAFPIPPPYAVPRGNGFVSQYPPLYSAIASPFLALLGDAGLRVPAAIGVAACALLFCAWVAPAVGRGWAVAGGLALAIATPLFFYGITVWEHSLTVALSLGGWVALSRWSRSRLLLAGFLIATACWLRAELALMGVSLALACYLHRRKPIDVAMLAAGALPAAAGLLWFNAALFGDPLGVHVDRNVAVATGSSFAAADFVARAAALMSGFGGSAAEGALLGLGVASCLGLGVVAARRETGVPQLLWLALAVGVVASLYGSLQTASASVPWIVLAHYNGFLIRLPAICLAGVGAVWVWRHPVYGPLRLGVGAGLGFLVLALAFRVTLTDFMAGGHWGPRMLLPAVPAIVALALVALHAEVANASPRRARNWLAGSAALIAAGLASTGVAVWILTQQKLEARRLQQAILAARQPVIVTNYQPLAQQLATIWGRKPMLLASSEPAFESIVAALDRHRIESFLLLWRPTAGSEPRRLAGKASCELDSRFRGRGAPYVFDVDLYACRTGAGNRR